MITRVYFTDPTLECIRIDTINGPLVPDSIHTLNSGAIVSSKWLHEDYISALECLLDLVMGDHSWDKIPGRGYAYS
jgi:hypothetical protein